jgi:hypothetical protein
MQKMGVFCGVTPQLLMTPEAVRDMRTPIFTLSNIGALVDIKHPPSITGMCSPSSGGCAVFINIVLIIAFVFQLLTRK